MPCPNWNLLFHRWWILKQQPRTFHINRDEEKTSSYRHYCVCEMDWMKSFVLEGQNSLYRMQLLLFPCSLLKAFWVLHGIIVYPVKFHYCRFVKIPLIKDIKKAYLNLCYPLSTVGINLHGVQCHYYLHINMSLIWMIIYSHPFADVLGERG